MNFNKNEFDLFRKEIKNAVKGVEEKFGVEIEFSSIKYDDSQFTIKTTVLNGSKEEAMKKEFNKYCALLGLKEEHYGAIISHKNEQYKIVGLQLNRRKYPIEVENIVTGERILLTESGVKKKLGIKDEYTFEEVRVK